MRLQLWKLVCEDYQILFRSSHKTRKAFTWSGIVMCFNYVMSILGMFHFFELIFSSAFISLGLSLFMTMMFMNIYKLCLSTLTKNETSYSLGYVASLIIRLVFVGFIGLIVITGFEGFLAFYVFNFFNPTDYIGLILLSLKDLISMVSFYWLLMVLFMLLFITPFIIKFMVSPKSLYNVEKKRVRNKIILGEHKLFKQRYASTFKKKYALDIEWREYFLDPPFNTEKIEQTQSLGSTDDFLKLFDL